MSEISAGTKGVIKNSEGVVIRRLWTKEQKRKIAEETFVPGASVSIVARRHDVNANQVFKWRQEYQSGKLGGEPEAPSGFVPVGVVGQDSVLAVQQEKPLPLPVPLMRPASRTPNVIELVFRRGLRIRIEGEVRLPVVRCVLKTIGKLS